MQRSEIKTIDAKADFKDTLQNIQENKSLESRFFLVRKYLRVLNTEAIKQFENATPVAINQIQANLASKTITLVTGTVLGRKLQRALFNDILLDNSSAINFSVSTSLFSFFSTTDSAERLKAARASLNETVQRVPCEDYDKVASDIIKSYRG